ncbi:MAG: class I SAM-dependent methyltransferase, partial [Verrucomicrobiota bacterium]
LPALAHRNRIKILKQKLAEEILRAINLKRPARIFNLGCGPATELKELFGESDLCEAADFTLLDFNEETIQYTRSALHDVSQQFGRKLRVQFLKKTVQQLLKEAAKPEKVTAEGQYDFLYCAGLFDYLSVNVCRQLMEVFYRQLAPGGLLLVTNVDGTRPFHNKLEFILDWNLIYRTAQELAALKPDNVPAEMCRVYSDETSVNVFLEIRKPQNA